MEAVDFNDRLAKDISNMRPLFDFDFMDKDGPHVAGIGMVERVGKLVRNVGIERPAKRHIHYLTASTDTEERFAIKRGDLDQFQFNGIPRRVHVIDSEMRLARSIFQSN